MSLPGAGLPDSRAATVDLHAHSTASDGVYAPRDVVRAAHEAGLAAVALTDHDTLGGVPEALATGAELSIRVVPGAELSTRFGDREWHLLALHVADVQGLDDRLAVYREARLARAERIVGRLVELGLPVTLQEILAESGGGSIGRPHVAAVLVRRGYVADFREAFDRWLGAGRPAFVDKELIGLSEACDMIHEAGGLAVLAHPGAYGRRATLEPMVRAGLDGLEVRHPGHAPDDERRLTNIAADFGLVRSGGSDWHGSPDGHRILDSMRVPHEWLEEQDERVAARRADRR